LEIHQALTRSKTIKNILPRHKQGGAFAAEGYARSSGRVGVCIATSGPGATNLVSGITDAMLDSVPLVAITGKVPCRMIGTDAFQETPIVEITKSITKHNYLCVDLKLALQGMNRLLLEEEKKHNLELDFSDWRNEIHEQKVKYPLSYKRFGEAIPPQYAIKVLDEMTQRNAIISTGVGQHQMWAAQFYNYKRPRQWLTSVGLGAINVDDKC
ncbi:Acetolactate synthase 3, chloroplastic, partial [Linum grandiflorum]